MTQALKALGGTVLFTTSGRWRTLDATLDGHCVLLSREDLAKLVVYE